MTLLAELLDENVEIGYVEPEPISPFTAFGGAQAGFREESSLAPAFNAFGDISFPGEMPGPVIYRTPEQLGIPRVVPDVKPAPILRNISPDPVRQDRTTIARAGAKLDKPRPRALPAATLAPHHQVALANSILSGAEAIGAKEVIVFPPKPQRTITTKGTSMKVTEEMKEAIRKADPLESCAEIGKRLGISGSGVDYWRGKFAKPAKSGKPAKKAAATSLSEIVMFKSRPVTLLVNDKIVDAWWKDSAPTKRLNSSPATTSFAWKAASNDSPSQDRRTHLGPRASFASLR